MILETILGLLIFLFFLVLAIWLMGQCNKGRDKGFPHSRGRDK